MRSAWLWPLVVAALRACDSTFDRAEFARLQRVLSEHQHPPSCDRLLVFHVWEAQGEQVAHGAVVLAPQPRGVRRAIRAALVAGVNLHGHRERRPAVEQVGQDSGNDAARRPLSVTHDS